MRYLLFIFCITFLILAAGCTTQTPLSTDATSLEVTPETGNNGNNSPISVPTGATQAIRNEPEQNSILEKDSSGFDSIRITIHNATVHTLRQRSGKEFSVIVFEVSMKNERLNEAFVFENESLICFQSDYEHFYPEYPQVDYHQVNITDPLLLRSVAPGEQIQGEVYFYLNKNVRSMAFYVKYPNWSVVGGTFIPDLSDVTQCIPDREYQKNIELVVHSAVQKGSLPDYHTSPGHKVAIINVSITNNNPTDIIIRSENFLLLTERHITLEHARGRANYLKFPFTIRPGETKSGSVLMGIYSGTRTNKIALTDKNFVIHSLIDLNGIYRYE